MDSLYGRESANNLKFPMHSFCCRFSETTNELQLIACTTNREGSAVASSHVAIVLQQLCVILWPCLVPKKFYKKI